MAKTMEHKRLIFCWLVVVIIGTSYIKTVEPTVEPTEDPVIGESTAAPVTGESTAAPVTGESTAAPVTGESTAAPVTGESTGAPVTGESTGAPVTDESTGAPVTGESTGAPVTGESTGAPVTGESTGAPVTGESTEAPVTGESTGAPVTGESTGAPVTGESTGAPVTVAPTEDPDACSPNPCGSGSTCEPRGNGNFTCVCLPGRYYNEEQQSCQNAKVFPAVFTLSDLTYIEAYGNKHSVEFLNKANEIIDKIFPGLNKTKGYLNSIVLQLSPAIADSRAFWLPRDTGVDATVDNVFEITSTITDSEANDLINKTISSGVLGKTVYKGVKKLCSDILSPCDLHSTTCESKDGIFTCLCLDGYIKTNYSNSVCQACPSGKTSEEGECVDCPFGYSGLACQEHWILALVIVGSVLGGLLLIMFIILPIVASKPSKKTSKKSKDTGGYESPPEIKKVGKEPFVNGGMAPAGGVGVPRIPRASASNGYDRGTNLEMTPSNSRQNLVPTGGNMRTYEDADEMRPYRAQTNPHPVNGSQINPYAASRAQTNPYAQNGGQANQYAPNRAQSNPYAQNRPQSTGNPYAQSRGQTNPYYTHDDGRRLN